MPLTKPIPEVINKMIPAEEQNNEVVKSLADSIRYKLVHPAEEKFQNINTRLKRQDSKVLGLLVWNGLITIALGIVFWQM